jgi:hypothetical protein
VRTLLALGVATPTRRRAAVSGLAVSLVVSLALLALLNRGIGLAWTPATAAPLTFWLVAPLVLYVIASSVASWQMGSDLGSAEAVKVPNLLMKQSAWWISLVGHPAIVVPFTVTLLSWQGGVSSVSTLLVPIVALVLVVMVFSMWQVRRRKWDDIDASQPTERKTLLLALGACLVGAALIVPSFRLPTGLGLGLLIASVQVIVAMISSRWLKISFHSAFNAFCSILLWPLGVGAVLLGLVWTVVVSWSRLTLNRHTIREVVVGGCLGSVSGTMFWLILTWMR